MKKLNITKEQFEKSRYFKNKYGKLEYVSESGRMFKTDKGKVLMFKESGEFEKQRREFNRKRKGISEDLNEFYDRINSIYEQLTNLTDEYSPYEEDDPDMANYFDLLHDAERKILRVSSDITDRIDHL